jgi:hypothetical protein
LRLDQAVRWLEPGIRWLDRGPRDRPPDAGWQRSASELTSSGNIPDETVGRARPMTYKAAGANDMTRHRGSARRGIAPGLLRTDRTG